LPEPARNGVLITRPAPGAAETAARVAALGFTPVLSSMLAIRLLPAHLPPPDRVAAVLVTSGSAVPGLPALFRHGPLLAVGAATARRAREAGFTAVADAGGDAGALAAYARTHLNPMQGPLLLAVGRGQGVRLERALRDAGFRVLRRTLYAAEPVRTLTPEALDALRGGRLHAVLFFSAETARQFVALVRRAGLDGLLHDVVAVAIGAPAGMALQALPWRRLRVAARPTQDEMLALLP
jgi:uroporphyrinogen-III synthase